MLSVNVRATSVAYLQVGHVHDAVLIKDRLQGPVDLALPHDVARVGDDKVVAGVKTAQMHLAKRK